MIILIAGLLGAIMSTLLTMHHADHSFHSAFMDALCGENAKSGCNVVNRSSASELAGLPVALWGFMYYVVIATFSLFYRSTGEKLFIQSIFLLAIFGALIDIGLLVYSLAALHTVCTICAITYLATFAVLGAAFREKKKNNIALFPDLSTLLDMKMSATTSIVLLFLLAPASGGFVYLAASENTKSQSSGSYMYHLQMAVNAYFNEYNNTLPVTLNNAESPRKGPENGVLNITEFADFLCPHCKIAATTLDTLYKKYPNQISVTYRHYPLDSNCNKSMQRQLHDGACVLSYASYCAGRQGKFWQMHDEIYANQEQLGRLEKVTEKDVTSFAKSVALNMAQFQQCLDSDETKTAISKDLTEADGLKIRGTPSVYINGKKMEGVPIDFLIEQLLNLEMQKIMQQ